MGDADAEQVDFLELVARYLDHRPSTQDVRTLNAELSAQTSARRRFVQIARLHGMLLERSMAGVDRDQSEEIDPFSDAVAGMRLEITDDFRSPSATVAPIVPSNGPARKTEGPPASREGRPASRTFGTAAAAMILAAALILALLFHRHSTSIQSAWVAPGQQAFGRVSHQTNARWRDSSRASGEGDLIGPGRLDLMEGVVELSLNNDVRLTLSGPTILDLESNSRVFLRQGQIGAAVEAGGIGFTVRTGAADIVDLGTLFGVAVNDAGGTQMHVFRGRVRAQPSVPNALATTYQAGETIAIAAGSSVAAADTFRPELFPDPPLIIDLADLVAGGDGTGSARNAGINAATGAPVTQPPEIPSDRQPAGDGRFHSCPGRQFIAGVFIPHGDAVVLDPDGHTSDLYKNTDNQTWFYLWAGGRIDSRPESTPRPTTIGDVDYNSPGHGLLFMHANKGITFDIGSIRAAHPHSSMTRFRAVCVNTACQISLPTTKPLTPTSGFRVFADGVSLFSREIRRTDQPFEIDVAIPPGARYLTLIADDGGDAMQWDWVTLGDPRLE